MLRASTAILAVLALGSTPVWAQDMSAPMEPPAASTPVSSPPAQAPTIQLPAQAPVPAAPVESGPSMVSQPVVQQAPVTPSVAEAAPAERASSKAAERRPAERSAVSPRQATAEAVQAPVTSAAPAQIVPASPVPPPPAASVPLTQPAVTPPPADTAPPAGAEAPDRDMWLATAGGVAALLLALGLGGGAYAATRARRRRLWDSREEAYETQPAQVLEPAAAPAVAATRPIGELEREAPLPAYATVEDRGGETEVKAVEPNPHPTVAQRIGSEELVTAAPTAASSMVPDGPVPQTRAERDMLLERMVSAPPSAENPFTSRKARLRRARIILQSREIQQKSEATQPFDWRTYEPSTSNPAPATPPRVTA